MSQLLIFLGHILEGNIIFMKIDFEKASFKDFENIDGQDLNTTAYKFVEYLNFLKTNGHLNYRIESLTPVGPEMNLMLPGDSSPTWSVCLSFE